MGEACEEEEHWRGMRLCETDPCVAGRGGPGVDVSL